jgi:hypothetical protein
MSTCCWKNCADRLARRRVAINLQFVRNAISVPVHTNTQYNDIILVSPISFSVSEFFLEMLLHFFTLQNKLCNSSISQLHSKTSQVLGQRTLIYHAHFNFQATDIKPCPYFIKVSSYRNKIYIFKNILNNTIKYDEIRKHTGNHVISELLYKSTLSSANYTHEKQLFYICNAKRGWF